MVDLREVRFPPRGTRAAEPPRRRDRSLGYRFKPKFILVVAEEFIATNAYRYGMNPPEVLVGDMNEVYQTAHIDDRLVVFTEIHFWERSLGHWHESYHMSFGASQF